MSGQHIYAVESLPEKGIDANAQFIEQELPSIRAVLDKAETAALAITLPPAGPEHDDWRTAIARDLAREYAPKRVNIVAALDGDSRDATLIYLGNAPGVTGQYCQTHE